MSGRLVEARLAGVFLRHGGGARAGLVASCTALVSALLLVALAVARVGPEQLAQARLSGLVTDEGVRPGYLLALGLTCLAPLTLLRQVVRLGSAARERRVAALRLAGATAGEVRRISGLEVGVPALVGGALGWPLFLLLRTALGGAGDAAPRSEVAAELRLVPAGVPMPWWLVLLTVLAVGAGGTVAGATVARTVVHSPAGASRHAPRPAPRPWGLGLLLLAVALLSFVLRGGGEAFELLPLLLVALVVAGVLALAPWVAHAAGRAAAARASTVPVLIAARRLATDARPAGRAAAAVGAVSLVAGALGSVLSNLPDPDRGFGEVEAFYLVPLALTGVVLLLALVLVVFSMAVHGVESAADHARSVASLAALGVLHRELAAVQRWEVGLVAVPMAVLGVLLGSTLALAGGAAYLWVPLVVDVVTVALVCVAVLASTALTRPWLRRAAAPENLRTP